MKSITNSVSLWFSLATLTYMPCAVFSSIWSWICICGGVAGLSAAMRAFFALGLMRRKRLRPCGEAATAARCMAGPADPFALGDGPDACLLLHGLTGSPAEMRSEEHTSELQSQSNLVCRLLLEKKKKQEKNEKTVTI